eukprot:364516-Chlamydomonas_euryale.AAC.29
MPGIGDTPAGHRRYAGNGRYAGMGITPGMGSTPDMGGTPGRGTPATDGMAGMGSGQYAGHEPCARQRYASHGRQAGRQTAGRQSAGWPCCPGFAGSRRGIAGGRRGVAGSRPGVRVWISVLGGGQFLSDIEVADLHSGHPSQSSADAPHHGRPTVTWHGPQA